MKIVVVDNLDRDTVSDYLVCEGITSDFYGEMIVELLNIHYQTKGRPDHYFKLVQDDYKLKVWEP